MIQKDKRSSKATDGIDRRWHLARNDVEIDVTEIEYALMRANQAFERWQTECLETVIDLAASGQENAMLHIIRMHERPKTIKDLARLANREDIPNIQYSLRKLIAAGLVVREGSGRAGVTYSVTERGREVTDRYAEVRGALLVESIEAVPDFPQKLEEATRTLELLTGIYEQMARVAATHRRSSR
ncbi:winged helix DNA-binding protein [Rhizobium sp. KVB221]|uniref:Winged helix DNA-binding protein n=1 Tax=Rhizobium setariae TaxID=2801340 RepID=A0A937CMJ3_9HYPH|nr:winged helix DNA-binding protein [Rhizobium setariae]MBL0372801.1 winged helix DNA-binding protein [Rhizobium setariae]